MAEERSGYKHDASDRKLDQSAESANEAGQGHDTGHSSSTGHEHETAAIIGDTTDDGVDNAGAGSGAKKKS